MVKKESSQSKSATKQHIFSSPVVAIFQWLSYAFWGWVGVATAALVAVNSSFALNGYSGDYESVAYVVAAVLVLLPIAIVTDVYFSRNEKNDKSTASMIIMVVHAVLFALIAVGALATMVFSLVSLVIGDGADIEGIIVSLITAATVVVVFGALTFRIMRPAVGTPLRFIVRSVLTVGVVAVMIWGIAGPVTQTVIRRDDDRAARALQSLQMMVSAYVAQNSELPVTNEQLFSTGDMYFGFDEPELVQSAFDDELVSYEPNIRPASQVIPEGATEPQQVFYYEICATFAFEDENRNSRIGGYGTPDADGFSSVLPRVQTESGTQCFQMKETTSDVTIGR